MVYRTAESCPLAILCETGIDVDGCCFDLKKDCTCRVHQTFLRLLPAHRIVDVAAGLRKASSQQRVPLLCTCCRRLGKRRKRHACARARQQKPV